MLYIKTRKIVDVSLYQSLCTVYIMGTMRFAADNTIIQQYLNAPLDAPIVFCLCKHLLSHYLNDEPLPKLDMLMVYILGLLHQTYKHALHLLS